MLYSKQLKNEIVRLISEAQAAWYSRPQRRFASDLTFSESAARFPARNSLHAYMHHHFHRLCPSTLREHRSYYRQEHRGFGEDAFHSMWYMLLREFKPVKCLEIGVYRGQVISLWALIAHELGFSCDICGISPFTPAGDEVSIYLRDIDYLSDTLQHHKHFGLNKPTLVRALSTEPEALARIQAHKWNLIYIDGNHDYEVALADYCICRDNLAGGGLLVMDDSSLYTEYRPPFFSFAGHPGPSRVVQENVMKEMRFLGAVGHNNVFVKC